MTEVSVDHQTTTNGSVTTPPEAAKEQATSSSALTVSSSAGRSDSTPSQVKGRIDIADEVVQKIAGLAAYEVEGVADLGGDMARTLDAVRERIGVGQKRGDQGVKAKITGREVTIDVTIMVEYGHVVMEVARKVQTNVSAQTNRMLGLRVIEVNVNVDDVLLPTATHAGGRREDTSESAPVEG